MEFTHIQNFRAEITNTMFVKKKKKKKRKLQIPCTRILEVKDSDSIAEVKYLFAVSEKIVLN